MRHLFALDITIFISNRQIHSMLYNTVIYFFSGAGENYMENSLKGHYQDITKC